jgi:hypothetical protein
MSLPGAELQGIKPDSRIKLAWTRLCREFAALALKNTNYPKQPNNRDFLHIYAKNLQAQQAARMYAHYGVSIKKSGPRRGR